MPDQRAYVIAHDHVHASIRVYCQDGAIRILQAKGDASSLWSAYPLGVSVRCRWESHSEQVEEAVVDGATPPLPAYLSITGTVLETSSDVCLLIEVLGLDARSIHVPDSALGGSHGRGDFAAGNLIRIDLVQLPDGRLYPSNASPCESAPAPPSGMLFDTENMFRQQRGHVIGVEEGGVVRDLLQWCSEAIPGPSMREMFGKVDDPAVRTFRTEMESRGVQFIAVRDGAHQADVAIIRRLYGTFVPRGTLPSPPDKHAGRRAIVASFDLGILSPLHQLVESGWISEAWVILPNHASSEQINAWFADRGILRSIKRNHVRRLSEIREEAAIRRQRMDPVAPTVSPPLATAQPPIRLVSRFLNHDWSRTMPASPADVRGAEYAKSLSDYLRDSGLDAHLSYDCALTLQHHLLLLIAAYPPADNAQGVVARDNVRHWTKLIRAAFIAAAECPARPREAAARILADLREHELCTESIKGPRRWALEGTNGHQSCGWPSER